MIIIKNKLSYKIKIITIGDFKINFQNFIYTFNNKLINIIKNKNNLSNNLYQYYAPDKFQLYNIICIFMIIEMYISGLITNITINYILLYAFSRNESYYYEPNLNINIENFNSVDIIYIYSSILIHSIIPYNFYLEYTILDYNTLEPILYYKQLHTFLFFSTLDIYNILILYRNFIILYYARINDQNLLELVLRYSYNTDSFLLKISNSIKFFSQKINISNDIFIKFLYNNILINYTNIINYTDNPLYYNIIKVIKDVNNLQKYYINIKFYYLDINTNSSTNIINYQFDNIFDNSNALPKINLTNEKYLYLFNNITFYYLLSNYINISTLTNNINNIINLDTKYNGSLTSHIDGLYDNLLISSMINILQNNIPLYVTMYNLSKNINYISQYNIINEREYDLINNLYNPSANNILYNNITNNIYTNINIINLKFQDIISNLSVLNLIIYGYNNIEININNNFFNKTIFNCLILLNDNNGYFYMIDIIEDYFAYVKYNNVTVFNINVDIINLNKSVKTS